MKVAEKLTTIGVIIGRFQLHELHAAHRDLIQSVKDRHARVFIFLGSKSRNKYNSKNRIPFKDRKSMILEEFPDVEIAEIFDDRSDEVWSKNLDKAIGNWLYPMQTVSLYGSRDSFIKHYTGKYPCIELVPEITVSATEVREQIKANYPSSKDVRAGYIASTALQYPLAQQTVDVAVFNEKNQMLMIKKPGEPLWRFIGGYSDPRRSSLEEDVRTEAQEEANIEVGDIQYVGSTIIDDWAYRDGPDKIKTAFFTAKYIFGAVKGGDDAEIAQWIDIDKINRTDIMEEHHVLYDMLVKKNII